MGILASLSSRQTQPSVIVAVNTTGIGVLSLVLLPQWLRIRLNFSSTVQEPNMELCNFCVSGSKVQPLILPGSKDIKYDDASEILTCLFCNWSIMIECDPAYNTFLKHLLKDHKLVICDVTLIASFKSYVDYWRKRFQDIPPSVVCTKARNRENSQKCYMLSDAIPEDKLLREKLQQDRLKEVLEQQEKERNDELFSRDCLFCKKRFCGNRANLFEHLVNDHNFHIGAPDNIVFGNELLDVLDEKLKNLQCLYCEKIFKDWMALKEHMRKKQHKRINPKNKIYDKFYVINYLELGKTWEEVQNEMDSYILNEDKEDEWKDWQEESPGAICLFCETTLTDFDKLLLHMEETHGFSFREIRNKFDMDFYKQVKLVNYIRRQIHHKTCIFCDEKFECQSSLMDHMSKTNHICWIPEASKWDQAVYYFPTYENDNLLCVLDDPTEDSDSSNEPIILPEDSLLPLTSVLNDENVRKTLL